MVPIQYCGVCNSDEMQNQNLLYIMFPRRLLLGHSLLERCIMIPMMISKKRDHDALPSQAAKADRTALVDRQESRHRRNSAGRYLNIGPQEEEVAVSQRQQSSDDTESAMQQHPSPIISNASIQTANPTIYNLPAMYLAQLLLLRHLLSVPIKTVSG